MDDYEHIDLDEIDFAPVEEMGERLALLSLEEAHDLLRLLLAVAAEDGALSRGGEPDREGDRRAGPLGELTARPPAGRGG
ncbi:DUF6417 family protein [Streptomyces sp. NPDC047082]|uniref:DUF6417 family protein n=1 Tax=Streptomyces sp. NPDC047082 TaxID=3155259 RepID=UPI0033CE35FF